MPRRVHQFTTSRFGGSAEITGFRGYDGRWNQINEASKRGYWYTGTGAPGEGTRHRGRAPRDIDLAEGRQFNVHIRYRGRDYYYTYNTPRGITGADLEADFRARIRAGYFRRRRVAR